MIAFSDGVIAIAATLLVLEIRPPKDTEHLLRGPAELRPPYLACGVTFMLVGQVWADHSGVSRTGPCLPARPFTSLVEWLLWC